MAVAAVVGMLAALPAQAGGGLIKITHSDTYHKWRTQPVAPTVAKVQPKASHTQPEVQVAVMAKSPSQPAAKSAVFIRR
jgi:hypothetical protein